MSTGIHFLALLGLCAAYLQGGMVKLRDFDGAIDEMRQYGLPMPRVLAGLVILVELGGSALILSGYLRWAGASILALYTLTATMIANRFWVLSGGERFKVENSFFEHFGLTGGLVLVALQDWVASARSLSVH